MAYLKKDEFVPQGQHLSAGEQININHVDCPAGHDTKKRLYIKRTDDGTKLIAYCHHCELSGSHGNRSYRTKRAKATASLNGYSTGKSGYRLPSDYEPAPGKWSSKGRSWVTRYGIEDAEISRYSIGYSEYHRRIILPVYNAGVLEGYQLRRIEPDDVKPKYLTRANVRPLFWRSSLLSSSKLVICEDILSGIKCARYQDSIALLKASETDEVVHWAITHGYKEFLIFLDDDNRQVKQAQIALKNRLSMFGTVSIIHADKDPKEHSNNELRGLLT